MEITLRPGSAADFEFCRRTHHAAYREVVIRQFGSWDEALQDKFFADGFDAPHQIVLADGVPCGFLGVDLEPGFVRVREIVLLPQHQRKSIGTRILQDILAAAAKKHLPVRLQVLKANDARRLYKRLGFRKTGTTDTHYQMECLPPSC